MYHVRRRQIEHDPFYGVKRKNSDGTINPKWGKLRKEWKAMRRQNPKTNINDFYPRPALTILLCSLFFISIVGKGQTEDMPLNCGHFLQFNRVTKQVAFILVKDWSTVNPTDTSKPQLIDVDYIKSVDTAKGIKCCILMFKDGTWADGDTIHIKKIIGPSNLPQEYERLKKLLETGAPLDNLAYHLKK